MHGGRLIRAVEDHGHVLVRHESQQRFNPHVLFPQLPIFLFQGIEQVIDLQLVGLRTQFMLLARLLERDLRLRQDVDRLLHRLRRRRREGLALQRWDIFTRRDVLDVLEGGLRRGHHRNAFCRCRYTSLREDDLLLQFMSLLLELGVLAVGLLIQLFERGYALVHDVAVAIDVLA